MAWIRAMSLVALALAGCAAIGPVRPPSTRPAMAEPADNPMTLEGVALGQPLFADTRLSGRGKMACQRCY